MEGSEPAAFFPHSTDHATRPRMNLDLGSAPDWVSALCNVVVAVAAVAAAVQGVKSLSTWRAETIGRRKMELAEEALALAYQAQEVIEYARHPVSWSSEGTSRPGRGKDGETGALTRKLDGLFVTAERMNREPELWSRLRTLLFRFRAVFGDDVAKHLEELLAVRRDVLGAVDDASEMIRDGDDVAHPAEFNATKKTMRGHGDDPTNLRLRTAVQSLAKDCRAALGGGGPR